MDEIATVALAELTPPSTLFNAVSAWSGFATLSPASQTRAAAPWQQLANEPDAIWTSSDSLPAKPMAAIGCSFLRDIEVCGCGYMFSNGRLLREYTHCSDAALDWLRDPLHPHNPLVCPRQNRVVIEEPVLLVAGPGHKVYGHWLLDYLPRIAVAQRLLGPLMAALPVLLPSGTPAWVAKMLESYCGVAASQLRYYSEDDDLVLCRRLCLPSFAHDGHYAMHEMARQLYRELGAMSAPTARHRICLSRRSFSETRRFEAREAFEAMATARGFEIVRPEELSFPEQAALFRSADCIVGEHGSGLHASVFADPGTIVGSIGFNWIQCHVSAAFEHRLISMNRVQMTSPQPVQTSKFAASSTNFTARDEDLIGLLDMVDRMDQARVASAPRASA